MENSNWFLLHDNAPAHGSCAGANNNVTTLKHPLYSSDPAPADFTCSLGWKGQRFFEAPDIIKNATYKLNRLSQIGFQECLTLQSLAEAFMLHSGAILKGNLAYMSVPFFTSQNKVTPGTFWTYRVVLLILNTGTRLSWAVRFTLRPNYPEN